MIINSSRLLYPAKKDENLKVEKNHKIDKGVSQNRNTKKEEKSILDSDELNAIAMYGSSKVQ